MLAGLPGSAAGITGQPGKSTAHMRWIAQMAREAFGTGPGERWPIAATPFFGALSSIEPFVGRRRMSVKTRAIESYIARLPIRSLGLEMQGFITRKRRNAAATRRQVFSARVSVMGSCNLAITVMADRRSVIELPEHQVERDDD